MNKIDKFAWILGIALILAIPAAKVWAACTYDSTNESKGSGYTVASCNLTTEAAPTLATEGKPLNGVAAIRVSAVASGNMTAAGKLSAYVYSPQAGIWTRSAARDLTISAAVTNETWADVVVPALPLGGCIHSPSTNTRMVFSSSRRSSAATTVGS